MKGDKNINYDESAVKLSSRPIIRVEGGTSRCTFGVEGVSRLVLDGKDRRKETVDYLWLLSLVRS